MWLASTCRCIGGAQTLAEVSQNFCARNPDQPDDNLSCPSVGTGGVACLPRTALCNGVNDCEDGADEGDPELLAGLNCKYYILHTTGYLPVARIEAISYSNRMKYS